jgi:hypothetical protein
MSFSLVETGVPGEKPLQVAPCINELISLKRFHSPGGVFTTLNVFHYLQESPIS